MALNNGIPARIIGRKDGGNAVQSLAYILGLKLEDKQTGIVYDFAHKNERVEFGGFFLPKNAPEWMKDPAILGNTIESMANRSTRPHDAQLLREFTPTFPHEISAEQRRFMLTDFCRELSRQGYLVVAAAHQPDAHSDERNFHPHIFLGLNEVTPEGFGKKFSSLTKSRKEWQRKEAAFLDHCKERWSELGAKQLERIGLHAEAEQFRHGHKSRDEKITLAEERGDKEYAAQLRDNQPNIHLGTKAAAMERKGDRTDKGDIHRAIAEANADRRQLRALKRDLARLERQDAFENLKRELTAAEKALAETRRGEQEYAQRDPAREQIAWEDDLAKAAIAKEKVERKFAEPKPALGRQHEREQPPPPAPGLTRMYRGVGNNVWDARHGEALFFSTDPTRAAAFGKVHYVDVTAAEMSKFERPHSQRILEAEPIAKNDWRTADPNIIARLQPLEAERKAAIEKERQFVERPANERQQEPARPRFGNVLITRAADAAMHDQKHGEHSPAAFKDALEKNRLGLACVTPEEAYKSHRENTFAKKLDRYAPVYQAGEIVIVREPRPEGNTGGRVHKLDQTKAEDYLRCLALDKSQLQGIEPTKQALDERAQMRQRQIEAAKLRNARGPRGAGLAAQQRFAFQRIRDAEQQRRERDRREYSERQKRNSGEIDTERYRSDPDYRREAQNSQGYKSPEEKKRDRENAARQIMEQQDRGR